MPCDFSDSGVAQTQAFDFTPNFVLPSLECAERCKFFFSLYNLEQLVQKPAVYFGFLEQVIHAGATPQQLEHRQKAFGCGFEQFLELGLTHGFKAASHVGLEAAKGFHKAFLEGAPNRHDLADASHLRAQGFGRAREFLEGKTRDFRDHIINARLKTGWCNFGDVVR